MSQFRTFAVLLALMLLFPSTEGPAKDYGKVSPWHLNVINAQKAWSQGFTGEGQTIAIIDTGIDGAHPGLSGRIVMEDCVFKPASHNVAGGSGNVDLSLCRKLNADACKEFACGGLDVGVCAKKLLAKMDGQDNTPCENSPYSQATPDRPAANCLGLPNCINGTVTADLAAGSSVGVAPGAKILAIQAALHRVYGSGSELLTLHETQTAALQKVLAIANKPDSGIKIASVYLADMASQGTQVSECENDRNTVVANNDFAKAVKELRVLGIPTIVGGGMGGKNRGLDNRACMPDVVSVAATGKDNAIAKNSNTAPFLTLFAPGRGVVSSVPNGLLTAGLGDEKDAPRASDLYFDGSRLAGAVAAGAFAIMRQRFPNARVDELVQRLTCRGGPILGVTNEFSTELGWRIINVNGDACPL